MGSVPVCSLGDGREERVADCSLPPSLPCRQVPLGYDAATAGNMASVVIGSGVAFTILVGPIFDRLNHLALVLKVGSAGICAACIGFVFAGQLPAPPLPST